MADPRFAWVLGAIVCLLGLPIHSNAQLNTTLSFEDTFNLEFPTSPFFINDHTLVYARQSMDIMRDSRRSALWQVNIKDGTQRPFLANGNSISQATLSPTKDKIAYTQSVNGRTQLFLYYLDTQQSIALTHVSEAPRNLTWSHDGKQIAFTLFTPHAKKPLFSDMPKKPKGAKWAEQATYIDNVQYRSDGRGYAKAGFDQIYILPVEGGTPRQLTQGAFSNGGTLAFSHDNQALYFAADRAEDFALHPLRSAIYKVTIDSGEVEQVTDIEGPEYSPSISPDGKWLAFSHVIDNKMAYQINDLMVMNLKTKETVRLTESLDRTLGKFVWRQDSKGMIFSYLDQGENTLAAVNLKGDINPLNVKLGGQAFGRPYTSGDFALSTNGSIVYTQASRTRPADLMLYRKGKQDRQLTTLNDDVLNHLTMAKVKDLSVISSYDDREIDAWVAYPPNFDSSKTYPLILEIHGGPHAAYGPHFSLEIQLMAAKGYVVVWSNPRGSSSYGSEFGNLIHHNYPSQDYNDLMDVVDAMVENDYIDSKQLFITGGSGGGVLTAWSIGKTNRFARGRCR